jgi:hypothetical protein
MGYLDQTRQGLNSTHKQTQQMPTPVPHDDADEEDINDDTI